VDRGGWQNRPHDGLRHPLIPGRALTPSEQYAALAEAAGYVPVPASAAGYIELLPVTWRAVNAYGIKISNRKYDCADLNPGRHQHSGVTARKGLWEVHYDPYDVTRVWVRNHHQGGWITVPWTQLKAAPAPFGEAAWDQARQLLARRGEDPATEAENRPGRRRPARQGRTRGGRPEHAVEERPAGRGPGPRGRRARLAPPGHRAGHPGRAGQRAWQRTGHRTAGRGHPAADLRPVRRSRQALVNTW